MLVFLGWVIAIVSAAYLISAFRRPDTGELSGAPESRSSGPNRVSLIGGAIGLAAGILLALNPMEAWGGMRPVPALGQPDDWAANPGMSPTSAIRWNGGVLEGTLEAGTGHYAVVPVDWEANRFEASWDITFTQLDRAGDSLTLTEDGKSRTYERGPREHASVAIGMMDASASSIDDPDHVSGSCLEACFSDDIRLRASDANFLLRTSGHDVSGKLPTDPAFRRFRKGTPVRIELGRRYRCTLSYDRRSGDAALAVRDEAGAPVVTRTLERLKEFSPNVAWFGVTVRNYNRFNKTFEPKRVRIGYTRPRAAFRIENLVYRQP